MLPFHYMAREGITEYYQLVDTNGDYINFDKLMIDHDIVPNNQLFVEYLLYVAE